MPFMINACKIGNRRPDFKEEKLKHIKEIIGVVKLRDFSSADAAYFESPPHPMARYGRLPEEEKALRVMPLEEERRLVQCVVDENLIIGSYVGLLGGAGLRKSEGTQWIMRHGHSNCSGTVRPQYDSDYRT